MNYPNSMGIINIENSQYNLSFYSQEVPKLLQSNLGSGQQH